MTSHTSIIGHGRRKRGGGRWEQHGAPLDVFVDQGEPVRPPGEEATQPNAAAFARGVGRGIAEGGVNGIRQRRRDGGGAAAEEA